MRAKLEDRGFGLWPAALGAADRAVLRGAIFQSGDVGTRCLLDHPAVSSAARVLGAKLVDEELLPRSAVAIQAIGFDKSPGVNWKVTWHQDVMFPFARPVRSDGYALPSVKEGIDFARPPRDVLEDLLAVRLHLDDCDDDNGPLRVVGGTHGLGIIPSPEIHAQIGRVGESVCTAKEGDALLMRPLLLHASSKARVPRRRRVLHLVYYAGGAITEEWHRALPIYLEPKAGSTGAGKGSE